MTRLAAENYAKFQNAQRLVGGYKSVRKGIPIINRVSETLSRLSSPCGRPLNAPFASSPCGSQQRICVGTLFAKGVPPLHVPIVGHPRKELLGSTPCGILSVPSLPWQRICNHQRNLAASAPRGGFRAAVYFNFRVSWLVVVAYLSPTFALFCCLSPPFCFLGTD